MHGLTNRSIEFFLRDTYGQAVWDDTARAAGLPPAGFEAMLWYDDALTTAMLTAAAERLGKPSDTLLEDLGTYLVSSPGLQAPRRLLRFTGASFADFLHSLEDLPDRVRLAVPDLCLPPMRLTDKGSGAYHLVCGPPADGFGHVIVGLLRAMADEYGTLALLDYAGSDGTVERIDITVHETGFFSGRRFRLGAEVT